MSEAKKPPSVASTATEIGIAIALAPPGTKAIAVATVAAPKVMGLLESQWQQRREKRRLLYLGEYLAGEPLDDEGRAEAELQALADDPRLRELVFDAFRVIDDTMAEEAVFVMGKLTRLYRARGLPADGFSRGVRRIMQDITTDDFAALREILTAVGGVDSPRDSVAIAFFPSKTPHYISVMYQPESSEPHARHVVEPKSSAEAVGRALELLKAGLLAQEGSSRASEGIAGPNHAFIDRSRARTLLSLMP